MDTKNGTVELFAQVVVAKNIQKDEPIFFALETSCVPPRVIPRTVCLENIYTDTVFNNIVAIENIIFDFDRQKDVEVNLNGNVTVTLKFELVFLVKDSQGNRAVRVVPGSFTKIVQLEDFCPSLTVSELTEEVEEAEVLVRNVRFDQVILHRDQTCDVPGTTKKGTPVDILVTADIVVKLTRFTDVIVVGELDSLEKDC
ncbi:MAG: hypothetical protein PHC60_04475 [Heliobacteriaceae bacterium]|nr:hypothetical protein [Heliobacteriaceae bacterium]MDD4587635.1 hypothetical protein [Heliobacteriaceae bacterium]